MGLQTACSASQPIYLRRGCPFHYSYSCSALLSDPSGDLVKVNLDVVPPIFNGLPDSRPARGHGALGLGADDGEPPLPVGDEAVHEPLLDQRGHHHLDVVKRHLGVGPDEALVGPEPPRPRGRGHERGVVRVEGRVAQGAHVDGADVLRAVAGPGLLRGREPALELALAEGGGGVEVGEVQRRGAAGACR